MRKSVLFLPWAVCLLAAWLPGAAQAEGEKPGVALAPLAAIGELGEAEKLILFNRLQGSLSESYRLVPREEYRRAEEEAFATLSVEQCTEENCIRKIQELLQVERLIVLQVIRVETISQLTITLVRDEDKIVRTSQCAGCAFPALVERIPGLVAEVRMADIGGAPPVAAAPAPPAPPGTGRVFIVSWPPGAEIVLDGRPLAQKTDALLENIPAGDHTVVLTKGTLGGAGTFSAKANSLVRLEVALRPAKAELLVTSTPFGATVLLDGREIGKTPVQVNTQAGKHELRLTLQDHHPANRGVILSPRRLNRLDVGLSKLSAAELARRETIAREEARAAQAQHEAIAREEARAAQARRAEEARRKEEARRRQAELKKERLMKGRAECLKEVNRWFLSPVVVGSSVVSSLLPLPFFVTTLTVKNDECTKKYRVTQAEFDQLRFLATTHENLAPQIARGRGPHLDALAALMGCPAAARPRLARVARGRYAALFPRDGASTGNAAALLWRLKRTIRADPPLAARCG